MRRKAFVLLTIICFLILTGCEKPIKVEIIWGSVKSIKGHSDSENEPVDCRIVTQFKETELITVYLVDYDGHGPKNKIEYDKCRSALLLKEGDRVSAIKETWKNGKITYELDP